MDLIPDICDALKQGGMLQINQHDDDLCCFANKHLYNFITISGYLAGKREWVHFGPNPWVWDRNEICGQIFSGSRTEHTCSVRLVDFEVEGIEEK